LALPVVPRPATQSPVLPGNLLQPFETESLQPRFVTALSHQTRCFTQTIFGHFTNLNALVYNVKSIYVSFQCAARVAPEKQLSGPACRPHLCLDATPEVAVGQTAKELRQMWRKRYTKVLDVIFEEFSSQGITVQPDDAMDLMGDLLKEWLNDEPPAAPADQPHPRTPFRFNFAAYSRDAHHYAVDQYYKTYFPRKRGGERHPTSYLDEILRLLGKGLNNVAIAAKLGVPKDRMRKQIEAAKRWHEQLEKIEEIKQRFPNLVYKLSPDKAGPERPPQQQPKHKKRKTSRGK
jgi:hypothetical protein